METHASGLKWHAGGGNMVLPAENGILEVETGLEPGHSRRRRCGGDGSSRA